MTKFLVDSAKNIPIGDFKHITAGGKEILVANINGIFYAINNICNHAGAELHKGIIEGTELICPRHNARWNMKNGNLICFTKQLKNQESYKIVVENDNVFVDI